MTSTARGRSNGSNFIVVWANVLRTPKDGLQPWKKQRRLNEEGDSKQVYPVDEANPLYKNDYITYVRHAIFDDLKQANSFYEALPYSKTIMGGPDPYFDSFDEHDLSEQLFDHATALGFQL